MTDYTDLWRDLHKIAGLYGYCTDDKNAQEVKRVCTEAADALAAKDAEIAALRAEAAQLRAALQAKE